MADKTGRLREWWTKNTTQAFEERAQCIARQYSKYTVVGPDGKEVHVNGNVSRITTSLLKPSFIQPEPHEAPCTDKQLTNGEDIADSGLAQAYAAWRHTVSLKNDGDDSVHAESRLPGLDYTDEQLFFIAFARVWETLARPATAVVRVRTDPHSPPYYRVMGTLRNMKEFHEAFKCKSGSGVSSLFSIDHVDGVRGRLGREGGVGNARDGADLTDELAQEGAVRVVVDHAFSY